MTQQVEAEDITRYHVPLAEVFDWYPVSKAVGNVRNDHPDLIEPLV